MSEQSILGLKRVLGLKEVVAIEVGQTIGAGVFAMTGIAIGICGAALPLAYALAVIPVALLMLPLAFLGAAIPTVGGNYTYPSRLVSPMAAFMGIWIYVIGAFFGFFPLYAITMVEYLKAFFPEMSVTLWAVIFLTVFYVINLFGVRLAAQLQGIFVLILLSALVMYITKGVPAVSLDHFSDFMPMGGMSVLSAAALLTFPYLGANAVIELGGEIKNPARVIPVSLVISISLVFVIYVIMSIVSVGVTDWTFCADQPLTESARVFLSGGAFVYFVVGGALLAIATTLNATFMWGTKSLMIIGRDRLMPQALTRVNARFGTPHYLLTAIWLCAVAAVISGLPIKAFAIYASIGGLVVFIPVLIAAIVLPKKLPDRYEASPLKIPIWLLIVSVVLGMVLFLGATVSLFDELIKTSMFMTWFFVLWVLLGIAYYVTIKMRLKRQGYDLSSLTQDVDF